MRTWLAVGLGLVLAVMWGRAPAPAAEGGSVTGLIANWYQVKDKISDQAYVQVVKKEHILKTNTDKNGLAAILSDLPKVNVRSTGGFQVSLDQVPEGEYFIVLQRGLASTPILVKEGRPILIKVPGKFPVNLGTVKLEMPLGFAPPRHHMIVVE